jgi:hypothetical protein
MRLVNVNDAFSAAAKNAAVPTVLAGRQRLAARPQPVVVGRDRAEGHRPRGLRHHS